MMKLSGIKWKSPELEAYNNQRLSTLNDDQRHLFDEMQENNLLQICIPTGAGKGYIMMVDLIGQIVTTKAMVFTICSHRLMLNTQHLKDIFKMLEPLAGKVGFVFVGSSKFDTSKSKKENASLNTALMKQGLSYEDIVSSTTRKSEVNDIVANHVSKGRKVVLLTTYHSLSTLGGLNIDTIYPDEAHTLASESENSLFRENFNQITYKRCFFLTATPKDCTNSDDAFLMNNESVFGRRIGLNFNECVKRGYIVQPVVHLAMPSNVGLNYDFDNLENKAKFVVEAFAAHSKFISGKSAHPEKIAPKILVKCASVDEMWDLHEVLRKDMQGVVVCAGASRNPKSTINHFIGEKAVVKRDEYLDEIKAFSEDQKVVVLHYDTMSEGINVSGFTATMFLGGTLPTIMKTLQNTGRSTRLHPYDRARLEKGEITTGDYSNWVKPYCAVIIPYWDDRSEITSKRLAADIRELRDNYEFNPTYEVTIGSDMALGGGTDDMGILNDPDSGERKKKLIDEINHEIDALDTFAAKEMELKKFDEMNFNDWVNFAIDFNK